MKKQLAVIVSLCIANLLMSQSFQKMQWINEPSEWKVEEATLEMQVTSQTDYWCETHYGFTVDDGPFYYVERGGEFEAQVKITGEYKTRFDQMGLMLRIDSKHWIKTGIEYVDGHYNFSTVVTNEKSSWNVVRLDGQPKSLWIKIVRRKDAVEIAYSLDGKEFIMSNLAYFPDHQVVKVGMMAASPDGTGFKALFEEFSIVHLPDSRRLEWLKRNQEK